MSRPLAIHIRGLVKRYGKRVALDGVDLDLEGPQIVGLVGADGAGKTTLLRAITGLLDVDARQALVLGHDLRGDVTELKAAIGYVPQSFSLHRELSVSENLRFTARLHRLPEDAFSARSREILARTGLAAFADRPAGKLSGGMKQKLAIGNALLTRPELLVLDEPNAGVDVLARSEIWSMLASERERAMVLISTGYMDEAGSCDRLVYLDRGRVIATGTPEELRGRISLDLYRAWGDDPRAIVQAARSLPYVSETRASGRFARVEVQGDRTPGRSQVVRDLKSLPGGVVQIAEHAATDMETVLLALARGSA